MIKRSAFTLIELVLVIVIVLILGGVALVRYGNMLEKARSAEAYAVLADIAAAESGYDVEYNVYAANFSQLDRYSADPVSDNFSYSLGATYGKATSSKGGNNYCMNFSGTKTSCP